VKNTEHRAGGGGERGGKVRIHGLKRKRNPVTDDGILQSGSAGGKGARRRGPGTGLERDLDSECRGRHYSSLGEGEWRERATQQRGGIKRDSTTTATTIIGERQ